MALVEEERDDATCEMLWCNYCLLKYKSFDKFAKHLRNRGHSENVRIEVEEESVEEESDEEESEYEVESVEDDSETDDYEVEFVELEEVKEKVDEEEEEVEASPPMKAVQKRNLKDREEEEAETPELPNLKKSRQSIMLELNKFGNGCAIIRD